MRAKGMTLTAAGCVAVGLLAGCGRAVPAAASAAAATVTIYVPCGMELPFAAAQEAFQQAHPGVTVSMVLDNGNVLVRRVLDKGERPDLLVSPGTVEMEELEKAGVLKPENVRPFGRFELVLFTPRRNPAGVAHMADLTRPEVAVVAIADPAKNSVGRYTRQALEKAGLWEVLQPKLTFADHPITAYQHVAREKAQASFAYRSCPLKTAPDKLEYSKVRIVESVPPDSYGPAFACIAPLTESARAREFIEYLLSGAGQKLLGEHDIPILPRVGVFVPAGLGEPFAAFRQTFCAQNPGILLDPVVERAEDLCERLLKQGQRPDLVLSVDGDGLAPLVGYGEPAAVTALTAGRAGGIRATASILKDSAFAAEAGLLRRCLQVK